MPSNDSAAPIASWSGAIFSPKLARSASSAARRIGVLAIGLVDEEAGRGRGRTSEVHGLLEAGLDTAGGIHHEDRTIRRREALDDVGDEVGVPGRVDERDPRPVALERADRKAERHPPSLLFGLEVKMRRAVVHAPEPGDGPGLEHELLGERRLAGSCMAGEDDAAKVGQVDALHRHRFVGPSWCRGHGTSGCARGPDMIVGYTPARDVRSFKMVHDQARERHH